MGSKYSKKYFFWFLSPLVLYQVDLICLTDVLFSLNTHDGQFGLSQKLKGNSKELCTICVLFNKELFSRNPAPVKTQPVKGYQPSPPPFQNHSTPLLGSHLTSKSIIPSFPYGQKCNCEIKFNKYYLSKTKTKRWLFHLQVHSKVHAW